MSLASAPGGQAASIRALLVDDDPAFLRLLAMLLRSSGFIVDTALDGVEALERLQTDSYDVLVADIFMPRLDGIGLIQKTRETHPHLPAIAVSFSQDAHKAEEALQAGAVAYFFKDGDLHAALPEALRKAADKRAAAPPATEAERALLETQLAEARTAVGRANAELARRWQIIVALNDIGAAIHTATDTQALLELIVNKSAEVMSAEAGSLLLLSPDGKRLTFEVVCGEYSHLLKGKQLNLGRGIAGWVAQHGEAVLLPDAYADPRFSPEFDRLSGFRTRSLLCIPLRTPAGVIGVMEMLNKSGGGTFDDIDLHTFAAFGRQAAIALENARLLRELGRMQEYQANVLESLQGAVVTIDHLGNVITMNAAAERLLGWQRGEIKDIPYFDIISGTFNAQLDAAIREVMGSGASQRLTEIPFLNILSQSATLNVTISPLRDVHQQLIGVVMVAEDVTKETKMRRALYRSMQREVADKLMATPDHLMRAENREVTVVFADIRDFTRFAGRMSPEFVMNMLEDCFTHLARIVFKYEGYLDKFIGDAVMAVFGAPMDQPDHAERACRAALEMRTMMNVLNSRWRGSGFRDWQLGIGINSGIAVGGWLGAEERDHYTVIGGEVNLAARLEEVAPAGKVLIGEKTYHHLKERIEATSLGLLQLRGIEAPVQVYELTGLK